MTKKLNLQIITAGSIYVANERYFSLNKYKYLDKQIECSGPEVIRLFSCSTQLSIKIFLLINIKIPTIVGILTFMSRKNSIIGLSESEKS